MLGAGGAVVAAAGWWVLTLSLWPASSRPYFGSSTDNTVLNVVFGFDGLGRLFGGQGNVGGSGSAGSSSGGATGLNRLFGSEMGDEISWLLQAALVALGAGLWITRRAPRTDRTRAALILWGGWLIVTGLTFSYMKGTIAPYDTVALAPAIAALLATAGAGLWRRRELLSSRLGLAAVVAAAGGWSCALLARTASWHPELRCVVAVLTAVTVAGLLVAPVRIGAAAKGLLVTGVVAAVIGAGSFGLATAASAHTGSIPTVGPATGDAASSGTSGGTGAGGTGGGATSTSPALVTALRATTTTWAAAVLGDQAAAELMLGSGKAVIAIGGWSGSDDSPTLAQFEQYVVAGRVHYFVAGGLDGTDATSTVGTQITRWAPAHYLATTIGGRTVYDLTTTAG